MKRHPLAHALASCLFAAIAIPSMASTASPSSRLPLLPVADIPATLSATNADVANMRPDILGDARARSSRLRDTPTPIATWVTSASLADAGRRTEVLALLASGAAVLVTSHEREARHELGTFGIEPAARTVMYVESPDGLKATSVEGDPLSPASAAALQGATDAVLAAMRPPAPSRTARSVARDAAPQSIDPATLEGRPFLRIDDQVFGAHGRSASQTIRIVRDSTATRDRKIVTVETEAGVIPAENGIQDGKSFIQHGSGMSLYVPDAYEATTAFYALDPAAEVRLLQTIPKSSGATNRKITEEISSKSAFGLSTSPDVQQGLNKDGINTVGKIPLSLSLSSETTERSVVEMNLDDYAVIQSAHPADGGFIAVWRFPLASDIAGNSRYFVKGSFNSTTKMTPMMRRASLETASEWSVDGAYEGKVVIGSRGTVTNRLYRALPVVNLPAEERPDPASAYYDPLTQPHLSGRLQPWVVSTLDLSSPYLTRSPATLIQSLSGTGQCLEAGDVEVTLAACASTKRAQQWLLEADMTYRNRAKGLCLTTDQGDGRMTVAECVNNALNQQWAWSADRIHSRVEGGERWRLHVNNGVLNAKFDAQRHFPISANPNHFLLRPWQSYPSKPQADDTVPVLAGASPKFPRNPEVRYRDIDAGQRWQTLPLRHGL